VCALWGGVARDGAVSAGALGGPGRGGLRRRREEPCVDWFRE
jgi:hypothetical protein